MKVNVALLQLASCGLDYERALDVGLSACRRARRLGADLALFPEMWNIGYAPIVPEAYLSEFDPAHPRHVEAVRAWQARAISADDQFCRAFAQLAAELEMAIVLTFLERWPGAPRNTAVLFDRRGRTLLTYAKVHTCAFSMEAYLTPGDFFPVAELETAAGKVQVGLMICFDREFPESARVLAVQGAELILVPNACDLEANRLAQIRSRAFENAVGIALANYPTPPGNGCSLACSPIAFDPVGSPLDPWLFQAPPDEGIFLVSFDLADIRRWREAEPWGNPWRRPLAYGPLTEPTLTRNLVPTPIPTKSSSSFPARSPDAFEIDLRPAGLEDLPFILELDSTLLEDRVRVEFMQRKIQTCETTLIRLGDQPVGFFILTREFFERPFLSLMVIQKNKRNGGIGTGVLRSLLAGRNNELFTSTNRSNALMIHLLGKVGFKPCGIIDHLDPGDPEVIYHWTAG